MQRVHYLHSPPLFLWFSEPEFCTVHRQTSWEPLGNLIRRCQVLRCFQKQGSISVPWTFRQSRFGTQWPSWCRQPWNPPSPVDPQSSSKALPATRHVSDGRRWGRGPAEHQTHGLASGASGQRPALSHTVWPSLVTVLCLHPCLPLGVASFSCLHFTSTDWVPGLHTGCREGKPEGIPS